MSEDKTLSLFSLFHIVKGFTTKSYSVKKFQDLLEKRLDKNIPIGEAEYREYLEKLKIILEEVEEALIKCKNY